MKQPTFIFIALLLLSFPFLSGGIELSLESQFAISMLLVFTIGIAHGSVDNLLYLKKSKMKPLRFYLTYLFLVGTYAATWFIFPLFALTLFLLISAYHFGQSQLTDYLKGSKFLHKLLYALWGIALISALINFKQEEILAIFNPHADLQVVVTLVGSSYVNAVHIGSSIAVVILMIYLTATNQLRVDRLLFEIFILGAINISFTVLPVLLGFTLYFVFLHSLKSLQDEFAYLKNHEQLQAWGFIKKLFPNTAISIAATTLIFVGIHFDYIELSYGFVLFVLISSITFPHAFVMEKFYAPNA